MTQQTNINLQQLQEEATRILDKSDLMGFSYQDTCSEIQELITKAFKAGQQDMLDRVRGVIPKHPTDTYAMNGGMFITRDKDDVDMYREEILKALDNLN